LNLPYREPLVPAGDLRARQTPDASRAGAGAFVGVVAGQRRLASESLDELAARVRLAERGLIVCGPIDRPGLATAIARLAAAGGMPILADGLANIRLGPHD